MSLLSLVLFLFFNVIQNQYVPNLPFQNPTMIDSVNGKIIVTIEITIVDSHTFFNGSQIPPTFRLSPGDALFLTIINNLGEETVIHFHGTHVSPLPPSDDSLLEIADKQSFTYKIYFPTFHPHGLFYYHSHTMQNSELQVAEGLSGLIVLKGLLDPFPELSDIKEQFFILSDFFVPPDPSANTTHLINGLYRPILTVKPGELQLWRFANIGPDIFYWLYMDNITFYQIARDGPLFNQIVPTNSYLIPSSSRADFFIITPKEVGTYILQSFPLNTGPSGDTERGGLLVTVIVKGEKPEKPPVLPDKNQFPPIPDLGKLQITRSRIVLFTQNETAFFINNQYFDPNRTDFVTHVGDIEEWTIINDAQEWHVFHIHQLHFQVMSLNGKKLPLVGYQDNVNVPYNGELTPGPGKVVIRISFEKPYLVGRFVFHCHILEHEDKGMMAVIQVLPKQEEILS